MRIAIDPGSGGAVRVQRLDDAGHAVGGPEVLPGPSAVAALEREHAPRWVFARPRSYRRLLDAGLRPHRPEVGEFVTSMDMAGLSLTLMPLDDELAALYDAPCETPGFRLGAGWSLAGEGPAPDDVPEAERRTPSVAPPRAQPSSLAMRLEGGGVLRMRSRQRR